MAQVEPKWEGVLPVRGLAKHFRCRWRDTIKNIATPSKRITAVSTPIITAMYVGSSCLAVDTGSSPPVEPFLSMKTSLCSGISVVEGPSVVKLPCATSETSRASDPFNYNMFLFSLSNFSTKISLSEVLRRRINIGKMEKRSCKYNKILGNRTFN